MTLEEKIKSALNPPKKTSTPKGKWDPETQPNIYELSNFLKKSGYRLVDVVAHENTIPELLIEPVSPGPLYPEISHDVSDNTFYTKVIHYGMLEASDVEEIIKGYQIALGVLEYLGSIDLEKLEAAED